MRQPWLQLLLVTPLMIHLFGMDEALSFQRYLITQGQVWRLLTCHLTHINTTHLLENLAGLFLVGVVFGKQYSSRTWLGITLFCTVTIGGALYLINTSLEWYFGLSGLLHGLLVAGAVMQIDRKESQGIAWFMLLAIGLKVIYEQWSGPLPGSELVMGGTVIVDSHLYGAIAGLVSAMSIIRIGRIGSNSGSTL